MEISTRILVCKPAWFIEPPDRANIWPFRNSLQNSAARSMLRYCSSVSLETGFDATGTPTGSLASACRNGSTRGRRDFDAIVYPLDNDGDADGIDLEVLLLQLVIAQGPGVVRPMGVLFDADLILMDQNVILKRIDGSVVLELEAPIVSLGRGGQDFEDHHGVEKVIITGHPRLSANHRDIRIGIHAARYFDAEIRTEGLARTAPQSHIEFAGEILLQPRMVRRAAGHGEHLAVQKFAAELRRAFDVQILLASQLGNR